MPKHVARDRIKAEDLAVGSGKNTFVFHNDIDEIRAHEALCPDLLTSLAIQCDNRPFDTNKD